MNRSPLDTADQRGDLTLGITLLLLALFMLLLALHPPVSAQQNTIDTSGDTLIDQTPDTQTAPTSYFHLRMGMNAEPPQG